MAGIGVVLNPYSRRYRKNPEKLKKMGFIVGEKGAFAPTTDMSDLRRVAEEFKKREIDILALSGGDGTNHISLTHFIQVYGDQPLPKIAFLRGGTLNTVAFSCGIFGSPEKILSNLLYKYHEDEPFETIDVDMMKVNGQYGFIWGCGVISRFMEAYYKEGVPSPALAGWTLLKGVGSSLINGPFACRMFERMDAEVIIGGKSWPFKNYSAIFAGSVQYIGLSFRVFHLAGQQGRFHVIGFAMPPRNLLKHIPLLFLGRPVNSPNFIEEAAPEMTIRLAAPQGYTIDGDMYPPVDRFDISMGPKLTVIVR